MKKVAVLYEKSPENEAVCNMLEEGLKRECYITEKTIIQGIDSIIKCSAQYFIIPNGSGYMYTTLMGSLQYNIMPRRQLHLFTEEGKEKRYRDEYAINIYQAVEDDDYVKCPNHISFSRLQRDSLGNIDICEENEQKLLSAFNSMILDEAKCLIY